MKKTPLARRLATLAWTVSLPFVAALPFWCAAAQLPQQPSAGILNVPQAAPPTTNRAQQFFREHLEQSIDSSNAKGQLTTLLKLSPNLTGRIEAAERIVRICGQLVNRANPIGRGATPEQIAIVRFRQLEENRLAIETTLPLLESLDEAHKHSLPALSRAADLKLMIEFQVKQDTSPELSIRLGILYDWFVWRIEDASAP